MNYQSLLDQATQAQKAGYKPTDILNAFQQSPDQTFNQKIADLRAKVGDEQALPMIAQELQYQTNPLMNPQRAIGEGAIKYGKEVGNAVLTGTAGNVISGVGTMADQAQGKSFDQAYQENAQPMNVPFFGNINPRSKSPLELTGQATELGASALPIAETTSHILAPLVGKSLANIGGAALTGALYSGGQEAQNKGATWQTSLDAAKTGAVFSGLLQGGLEVVQRWPEIKRKVLQFTSGYSNEDLQGVDPKKVEQFMKNPNDVTETVNNAHDSLKKAGQVKGKEYGQQVKDIFGSDHWSDTTSLKSDTEKFLDGYGITLQNGKFTDTSFLGSKFDGDAAAQGQIKYYVNKIMGLPSVVDTASLDTVRQQIGTNTNFATMGGTEDKIGSALYGKVRGEVLKEVPELAKPLAEWEAWQENLDIIGNKLDKIKSGEPFLMNSFGKNKSAVLNVLQDIENTSGTSFLNDVRAANIAQVINKGRNGPVSSLIGMIAGAGIGNIVMTGGLGMTGGAFLGRQIGRRFGPVINQAAGTALMGALENSPIGTTMSSGVINPIVQGIVQKTIQPPQTQEEKNYLEFNDGFRQNHPTASEAEINQAYQQVMSQGMQSLSSAPMPQIQAPPQTEQSYTDFARGFQARFPNAPGWLVKRTYDNLQLSNSPQL